MITGESSGKPIEILGRGGGGTKGGIPSRGVVVILPVTSCHKNRFKLRLDGPLGWSADLTYLPI